MRRADNRQKTGRGQGQNGRVRNSAKPPSCQPDTKALLCRTRARQDGVEGAQQAKEGSKHGQRRAAAASVPAGAAVPLRAAAAGGGAGSWPAGKHCGRSQESAASLGRRCCAAQVYTKTLRISNTLGPVELTIRPGASDRYTVSPATLRLKPGESKEVEVKLRVLRYLNRWVHGRRT